MLEIMQFILIGLAAGVLSGFFGIGGGILVVPALIYICGFPQLRAQGTSLAILLPPVGALAFMEYYKKGNVDLKAGILICGALLIGAFLGSRVVQYIPAGLLRKGFAVFLVLVSIKMFISK